ncbi:hypothetical protein [Anoxybacillus sp. TBDG-1]
MMMYFKKNMYFVLQDVQLNKTSRNMIIGVIALLMILGTIPWGKNTLVQWHSAKDFILLYRYEFFHFPAFLLLLGSTFKTNGWIILRRYRTRTQIGMHKVFTVIFCAGLLSFIVFMLGVLCTAFVQYIVYPNMKDYHAIFLYVPKSSSQHSSFIYFICTYFLITTILGMVFVIITDVLLHRFLSIIALMTFVILDRLTTSIIPYLFYVSEEVSPISTIMALLVIVIILGHIVRLSSIYKSYYAQDDFL